MNDSIFLALLQNGALLLALVAAFDMIRSRQLEHGSLLERLLMGLFLGAIGVLIMAGHYVWLPGIVFDLRSVLLSLIGLFFGIVPTFVAMLVTGLYRLMLGGDAAVTGVLVIMASGVIGLAWQRARGRPQTAAEWAEFYRLGLLVHLAMLACMFVMPWELALEVLSGIALPVMLIYPLATVAAGILLVNRMAQHRAARALEDSESRFRRIVETGQEGIWELDGAWRTCYANPRMQSLLGTSSPLSGRSLDEFLAANVAMRLRHALVDTDDSTPLQGEYRLVRGDGGRLPVWLSAVAVRDGQGRFAGAVLMVTDLSAAHRDQEQLKLQAMVLDQIQDHVTVTDLAGKITYVNQAELSMLGHAREEIVGQHVSAYGDNPEADSSQQEIVEATLTHGSWQGRVINRRANGDELVLDLRTALVRGDDGEAMALAGIGTDITAQLRMEQALRAEEERFAQIFEGMSSGAVIYQALDEGADFLFVNVNAAVSKIDGLSAEDLLGRRLTQVFPKVEEYGFLGCLQRVWRTGEAEYFPLFWYEDARIGGWRENRVFRLDSGLVVAIYNDLTEQKRAEHELHLSQERFELAMRGANDGLFDWNLHNDKVYFSPRWKSMLGYDGDELEDDLDTWERLIDPQGREQYWAKMRDYMAGRRSTFELELRMRHKAGHWVEILSRAYLLRDEQGKPLRVVGTHIDITERKRAERELRLAAAVFEQSAEAVMITNMDANLVQVNPAFGKITGYRPDEVIGGNPRLMQSGRHDRDFYRALWKTLQRDGQWRGEIWNRRKDGSIYPAILTISKVHDSSGRVTNYVGALTDISDMRQIQDRLDFLDTHDTLTSLPNRQLFNELLQHAMRAADRAGKRVALMYLDLDQFKNINESLGHRVGDLLLVAVTQRWQQVLRGFDTLARAGGDEFLVLMEQMGEPSEAAAIAQRLIQAMRESFVIEGHTFYTGVSIGIAVYPQDGEDMTALLKNVDTALFRAKESGRGVYRFFSRELADSAQQRVALETLLRQALEHHDLDLHYQPQVNLADHRVLGMEALARWQSPDLGPISPARFIPLAEETGLIVALGDWAMLTACRQMKRWLGNGGGPGYVAVNVSAVQFHRGDLQATVVRVLRESGIDADQLELEITESSVLTDPEQVIEKLLALKEIGVRIAMDDFGTGYSSLAYLKRLPVDRLKIDQGFVRDMLKDSDDEAIVRAVIALGQSLRLNVLAEGVETVEQAERLKQLGCDSAQGWYFGRPQPAD